MILDLIPTASIDAPDPLESFGGQLVERAKRPRKRAARKPK